MSSSPSWGIVEYRGGAGLDHLEQDWRRLYGEMPQRSSYHAFEAHRAYAELLCRAPEELRYLALTDGRLVRAICVLEATLDWSLRIPTRAWRVTNQPHSPLRDVICPEDDARRVFAPALVRHLRRCGGGRLLVLGPLPGDSVLWDGIRDLDRRDYCLDSPMSSFVFDCTKPYEEHAALWSRSFRRDLRRHRQRLEALEDVRFVTAAAEPGLSKAFEAFLDVEASGWKGESGARSAIRFRARQSEFFHALAGLNCKGDHCEINSLYAEGTCIAAQFCMVTGRECDLHKSGYEESYSRLGPGQILIEHTLRRCCDDADIDRFSLVSDSAWQSSWHPDSIELKMGFFSLGRWSGPPLIGLLRLRFGYGRRAVRWLRSRRERSARTMSVGTSPSAKRGRAASVDRRVGE